uniref:Uncharacterized protein n=1 Tax=Vespula pensylvanica TaxID=30213 RepID=A0A834NYJ1_VESPE|nr:hypothetical protein H0235_009430 [Vespula pensylvanica]
MDKYAIISVIQQQEAFPSSGFDTLFHDQEEEEEAEEEEEEKKKKEEQEEEEEEEEEEKKKEEQEEEAEEEEEEKEKNRTFRISKMIIDPDLRGNPVRWKLTRG